MKIIVQGHRLPKTLRPNHRTTEHFPSAPLFITTSTGVQQQRIATVIVPKNSQAQTQFMSLLLLLLSRFSRVRLCATP